VQHVRLGRVAVEQVADLGAGLEGVSADGST
jgi:hypothetical protein